jgi:hypothetical protein
MYIETCLQTGEEFSRLIGDVSDAEHLENDTFCPRVEHQVEAVCEVLHGDGAATVTHPGRINSDWSGLPRILFLPLLNPSFFVL